MTYLILVGGKGTRLKSVVSDTPKPLAPFGNRPFLEFFFEKIGFSKEDKIYLLCGYGLNKFVKFKKKSKYKLNIVAEDSPLGTGGAIKNAFKLLSLESAIVFNGDCIQDICLKSLKKEIKIEKEKPLMVLRKIDDNSRYGSVKVKNKYVVDFLEKTNQESSLINSGIYYLNKKYVEMLPEKKSSIEKDLFEKNIKTLELRSFLAQGSFIDIGIPEDYLRAIEIYS